MRVQAARAGLAIVVALGVLARRPRRLLRLREFEEARDMVLEPLAKVDAVETVRTALRDLGHGVDALRRRCATATCTRRCCRC